MAYWATFLPREFNYLSEMALILEIKDLLISQEMLK